MSQNRSQVTIPNRQQPQERPILRGDYESQAVLESVLQWAPIGDRSEVLFSGQSDMNILRNLRGVLLALQTEFGQSGGRIVITGQQKDEFNKRLTLLQAQIEGLMKRKIQYAEKDQKGGTRFMDYTGLLNEKETQIVELEKKINNYEERLRRATKRETQLENHIALIYADLKKKQQIILAKNEVILAEVASSNSLRDNINKIKRNLDTNRSRIGDLQRYILDGVTFPQVGSFEIRSDVLTAEGAAGRSRVYQGLPQNQKNKTQLIQMFRQFERLNTTEGISDEQMQRILENFLIGLNGTRIKQSVSVAIERRKMQDEYMRLKDQFQAAVSIYAVQMQKIKKDNPSIRIDVDTRLFEMLREQRLSVFKLQGDIINLERFTERTIEVPVQDTRTKHIMHLLAVQLKKFTQKYPKLKDQIDGRLSQYFQQQLIDVIQVDELERIVQIVKYVPQTVKVENVWAYSSEKSRKVEFHLRVLIKALLQQLQKIKKKTGATLQIDEGIIGMINQQIMGVVDVDDILKVFRVVPKIVEVERIVEKIVDRIVEVPTVVTVDKIKQKIVEIEKIKQIEKIVHVPIQSPTIVYNTVEKIVPIQKTIEVVVQVPKVVEKIVEVIKQVPKVVQVDKFIDKIVQVQKIREIQTVVNHIQQQIRQIQVIKQKIVATERIVQKLVQVPVIVEKIVQRVVQVPQIIEVQKIRQVIVEKIEYRNAKQIHNEIQIRNVPVDRIIEKPIPIIQIVEKIVEVPQIIQKIVTVTHTIRQPYEVEVIRQKIVIQQKIRQIQKYIDRPVTLVQEVIKEVINTVPIPMIQEVIRVVQQIVQKPIIQRIQTTIIKEVYLRDPIIVRQPKTVEIQKIVNHYIQVPKPIKYIQQKIVEVIRHVDRIKQIKVPVEKIIQKMVEVPKVVEVEKIVERIVVVPRVIEKVVEVPQFIERVVPKIIIEERIKTVEKIVQVPVIQERMVEVEVPRNVYIQVEKIVEKIVDKLVEVPKYEEKIITNEIIVEKIVEVIKEIPKQIKVDRIVPSYLEVAKVIQIQKQIIVPIQVPVPVQKIVEKLSPITQIVEKIVQIPQVVEKIIPQRVQEVRIESIPHIQQKIVIDTQIKQVIKEVPYIQDRIVQVQTIQQKIVPIQSIVQQIVTAKQIVEKIVERSTIVPKIYEVEKISQKVVEVPKIVEVERVVNQIVNVNKYIQSIVQKIVEVPVIIEQIKQIVKQTEKFVQVHSTLPSVKQVEKVVEKVVIMEKFNQVVRTINHIEKVLQVVDRYEQTPVEIIAHHQKLVQVPYILEKIVQKIVIMPQIVEVLKYVHEVIEQETLGVAVGVDVASHQQKYKLLTRDLKTNLDSLLGELRKIKSTNSGLKIQIEIIQKFLSQLDQFILFPRIVQVPQERIVQKIVDRDRVVTLPTADQRSLKMELTLSLLVEKLILELKRIKKQKPQIALQLEDDVRLIFFSDLDLSNRLVNEDLNSQLKSFSDTVHRKFQSLGNWSLDHQMMLNSFLQERFLMANLIKNANLQIEKTKTTSMKRDQAYRRTISEIGVLEGFINRIKQNIDKSGLGIEETSVLKNIFRQFDTYSVSRVTTEPTRLLGEIQVNQQRVYSLLRQKDGQINALKNRLLGVQNTRVSGESVEIHAKTIEALRGEVINLKNQNSKIRSQHGSVEIIANYRAQIDKLNQRILQLQQQISNEKNRNFNKGNEQRVVENFNQRIRQLQQEITNQRNRNQNLTSGQRDSNEHFNRRIYQLEQQITNQRVIKQRTIKELQKRIQTLQREIAIQRNKANQAIQKTGVTNTINRSPNQLSPVQQANINSPDYNIRLIQSTYTDGQGGSSVRQPTYGQRLSSPENSVNSRTNEPNTYGGTSRITQGTYQPPQQRTSNTSTIGTFQPTTTNYQPPSGTLQGSSYYQRTSQQGSQQGGNLSTSGYQPGSYQTGSSALSGSGYIQPTSGITPSYANQGGLYRQSTGTTGISGIQQGGQGSQGLSYRGSTGTSGILGIQQGGQGSQGVSYRGSTGTSGTGNTGNTGNTGTSGTQGQGTQGSRYTTYRYQKKP